MKSGIRYLLTEEQITKIVDASVSKAIESYRTEQKKVFQRKENENSRITKRKLQAYRRVKASLKETEEFPEDEKVELRWAFINDLMGSGLDVIERADSRIKSVEFKRKKDSFEAKRRYRELYAMYIDEEERSIREIAEIENISEKIVYRDLGIACKILSVYLLGMG